MPRDVSLSDSKCWNGGKKWVKRDAQNFVASYVASTLWLSAWHYIFEISYADRYYLDEQIAFEACLNSFWFVTYEFSKFVFAHRISPVTFFNKTLEHDLTYFNLSNFYQIWHTASL